jgi:hypothetical protein
MEAYYVALPLIYPWKTAYGRRRYSFGAGEASSGTAKGETAFLPRLSRNGLLAFSDHRNIRSSDRGKNGQRRSARGLSVFETFAKAGIEMAWWNRPDRRPCRLLGGKTAGRSRTGFGVRTRSICSGNIEGVRQARIGWSPVGPGNAQAVRSLTPDDFRRCNSGALVDLPFQKWTGWAADQPLFRGGLVDRRAAEQSKTPSVLTNPSNAATCGSRSAEILPLREHQARPGGGLESAV